MTPLWYRAPPCSGTYSAVRYHHGTVPHHVAEHTEPYNSILTGRGLAHEWQYSRRLHHHSTGVLLQRLGLFWLIIFWAIHRKLCGHYTCTQGYLHTLPYILVKTSQSWQIWLNLFKLSFQSGASTSHIFPFIICRWNCNRQTYLNLNRSHSRQDQTHRNALKTPQSHPILPALKPGFCLGGEVSVGRPHQTCNTCCLVVR